MRMWRGTRTECLRMIPLSEAQTYVLKRVKALPPAAVHLDSALGLVLAEPVVSHGPIPPFDNTAVDGFALRIRGHRRGTGSARLAGHNRSG